MKIKFKKGSKIHIKDSQKGSFTKYCNGKVTEECIQKGKNSPDPKIRKKATFAANARKWNHKDGGRIKMIRKAQTGLQLTPETSRYMEWKTLSPDQQWAYRKNRAKAYLNSGPSIPNLWEAFNSIIGNRDPENPYLNTGTAPTVGFATPTSPREAYKVAKYLKELRARNPNISKAVEQVSRPVSYNVPKGPIKDTGTPFTNVKQPLEELTVRKPTAPTFYNPTLNPAERAAAKDFLEENPNFLVQNPGAIIRTPLPTGRPATNADYRYPASIMERIQSRIKGLQDKAKTTFNTKYQNPNSTPHERYMDRKTFSKKQRTQDKYARAYEAGKATYVNSGQNRIKNAAIEEDWKAMKGYSEFTKRWNRINLRLEKYKDDKFSFGYKQARADKKKLVEEWRKLYKFKNKRGED